MCLFLPACGGLPGPKPPPPPPPWECPLEAPRCDLLNPPQQCSTEESPCWHNRSQDPEHCEMAPACPLPPEHPPVEPPPIDPPPGACRDVESTLVASRGCSEVFRTRIKVATTTLGDLTGNDPQENLKTLAATLIEQNEGMCAFGGIEAVFILRNDGRWEENHTVFFGDGGWTNNGFGKYKGCHENTEFPPEAPPVEPLPSGECVNPDPTGFDAEFNLKKHNQLWDSTYRVVGRAYCDEIPSFVGRNRCPLREEGDPEREVCERQEIDVQAWWCNGQPIESEANPAQARCHGTVRTCTESGETCAEATW